MRCERIDTLLPAYLDGDLPGRLNRRVSDHLDACERCRDELAAQQHAVRQLDAGRFPVTIDLWADFSRRLQVQQQPAPCPWRPYCRPGFAAALGAAAVALVALTAPRPGSVLTPAAAPPVTVVASVPRGRAVETAATRARSLPEEAPAAGARALVAEHSAGARANGSYQLAAVSAAEDRLPVGSRLRSPAISFHSTAFAAERPAHRRALARRHRHPELPDAPEPRAVLVSARPELPAALPGIDLVARAGRVSEASERPLLPPTRLAADRTAAAASHAGGRAARAGDPLRVAEALVSVEQDAASDQMKGELLRLAQEVARVGGEAGTGSSPDAAASDTLPSAAPAAPMASPRSEEGGGQRAESSSRPLSSLPAIDAAVHGD